MTSPSDKTFQKAKLIKLGRCDINADFKPIADWIYKAYGVTTMDINYDTIQNNRPRLEIVFEFNRDREKFNGPDIFSYDDEKRFAIARQFKRFAKDQQGVEKLSVLNLFSRKKAKYNADNILVIFSSFESIAMREAIGCIPGERIDELQNQIGNDNIWKIVTIDSGAIFFFYTNEQVKANETNGTKKELSLQYYDLLKEYDEFKYFEHKDFLISLDSKENFDNKFNSNWYNYFR
jgi:hypothetical protein